jgi:ribosome-associated protein
MWHNPCSLKESKIKMTHTELLKKLIDLLEDKKAEDLVVLEVAPLTSMTDAMIIASGTSNPHLRAMMKAVVEMLKKEGIPPLGVEGEQHGEWILLDLGSILIHLMLPEIRSYYELEKLWSVQPT